MYKVISLMITEGITLEAVLPVIFDVFNIYKMRKVYTFKKDLKKEQNRGK